MFIDEVEIIVRSGKGGDGIVHFRKEKYINRGGPDGGDGGRGGDVFLMVNQHLNSLNSFRHKTKFTSQDGKRGGPKNQTGRSAEPLIISVPAGTLVYDHQSGDLLGDLTTPSQKLLVCRGGRGGRGNARFATSQRQAPQVAEKGEPGIERKIKLELQLIADVGVIGMPNAGKSSLLAALTNATPKIADYPFTTLSPNLGVFYLDDVNKMVLADIPGLIEGAHAGVGLGDSFLRHIQRTRVLIHVIDGLSQQPFADFTQINSELALFDPYLAGKSQQVAYNKIDLPEVKTRLKTVRRQFQTHDIHLMGISAKTHENLMQLMQEVYELLQKSPLPEKLEAIPLYRPKAKTSQFAIKRVENGWRVVGEAIERAAAMTYWEYDDSIQRFQRIMQAMGVEEALRQAGIKEGDTVCIGKFELTWQE
jgi:GTP-binding protein